MYPTHPTGKEDTYSGLPCKKGELLVEHASMGMALFDPLKDTPFSNILFIPSLGKRKTLSLSPEHLE